MNRNIPLIAVAAIVMVGIAIGILLSGAGQTGPFAGALVPNESTHFGARVEQPVVDQGPVAAISQGTAQTDGIISAYAIASFETFPSYINLRGRIQNPSVVELAHEMDIVMDPTTVSKSITMPIRQGETWEVYVEWEGSATHRLRVIWTPITA